jgi:perosamine synthetase
MRLFKRTLPPAATPITFGQIISGLAGILHGDQERERFRSEIKDYFGVSHCFLVSSGKAALTIVLKALHEGHPERKEVIIPAYTCYSVPSAVKRAGLEIKLCDIDRETLDFDYSQLQEVLQSSGAERLLAIIPRHIFGVPADLKRLRLATSGFNIVIVEDAAQVMGGTIGGKKLGTLGDAGVFSLGRGKALSTAEGGIVLTDNDNLAFKIKKLIDGLPEYGITGKLTLLLNAIFLSFFMHPLLFWLPKSLPFLKVGATIYDTRFAIRRFSDFQAGLSRGWRQKLHSLMKIRTENASFWKSRLTGIPTISMVNAGCRLDDIEGDSENLVIGPVRYPIVMRDQNIAEILMKKAESEGAGIMITYPDSVAGIPELRTRFSGFQYPAAKEFAKKILTFPTHPLLSDSDKERIDKLIKTLLV